MLTLKKTLVLSVFLGAPVSFIPIHAKSLLDEMIEEMNEVQARFERRFNRISEELKKGAISYDFTTETATLSISENKTTNTVDVIIAPLLITEKTFEAALDQENNILTISTPAGNATIHLDRHLISAGFNHQIKQEQESRHGKGKQQITLSSYNQTAKTVGGEMAPEEAQIEYDQAAQKLTISIPLRKKLMTKIPVIVKETKEIKPESK